MEQLSARAEGSSSFWKIGMLKLELKSISPNEMLIFFIIFEKKGKTT